MTAGGPPPPSGSVPAGAQPAAAAPIQAPQFSAHAPQNFPDINSQCLLFELAGKFLDDIFVNPQVAAALRQSVPFLQVLQLPSSTNRFSVPTATGANTTITQEPVPVRQLGVPLGAARFQPLTSNPQDPEQPYGSNLNYINYLSRYENLRKTGTTSFFNLTNDELAQMQHRMVVSQVLINKDDPTEKITTPILNNHNSLQDFGNLDKFVTLGQRTGAGIEKISINYEGIDTATSNIVMVEATYVFQDIREMMSKTYAKLFTLDTTTEIDQNTYRKYVEFDIGWESHSNFKIAGKPVDLKSLNLRLRTHLVKYSFDLRRDGSIVVNATYRGSFIQTLNSAKSNILELAKRRFEQIRSRTKEIQDVAIRNSSTSSETLKDSEFKYYFYQLLLKELLTVLERLTQPGGSSIYADAAAGGYRIVPNYPVGQYIYDNYIFGRNYAEAASGTAGSAVRAIVNDTTITIRNKRQRAIDLAESVRKETIGNLRIRNIRGGIVPDGTPRALKAALEQISVVEKRIALVQTNLDTLKSNIQNSLQNAISANIKEANLAKLAALRQMSEGLINSSKVYYLVVGRAQIEEYQTATSEANTPGVIEAIDNITDVTQNGNKQFLFSEDQFRTMIRGTAAGTFTEDEFNSEEYKVIPFVFYGDFIESVLRIPTNFVAGQVDARTGYPIPDPNSSVYQQMLDNGDDVRIDFGFLSFKTPFSNRANVDYPLYYMPISLHAIQDFFNRDIISKGLDFYTINDLLKNINSKLLTGMFSACAKDSNAQGFVSPNLQIYNASKDERLINETKDRKNVDQYFIYGSKNTVSDLLRTTNPITTRNFGNYRSNVSNAIPHFFFLGKDRGIVKNMSLSDISDETVKTAIYYSNKTSLVNSTGGNESSRKTGLPPAVFTANIETIGFPVITLGQLIYIDLKPGFLDEVRDIARTFKATGYYCVYKVNHEISAETFSTNIYAHIQVPYTEKAILDSPEFNVSRTVQNGQIVTDANASRFNKNIDVTSPNSPGQQFSSTTLARLQNYRNEIQELEEAYNARKESINLDNHVKKIKESIKNNNEVQKAIKARKKREDMSSFGGQHWWSQLGDYSIFNGLDDL